MENKLELYIQDVGDSVHDVIARAFDSCVSDYSFGSEYEYAPWGDTYAPVGRFIGDDEEVEVRENFENELSYDEVIDRLKADPDFKSAVMDMINYVAWNRPVEV